jgi:hypothetical protein
MQIEFLPFSIQIEPIPIAGAGLWAMALYLGLPKLTGWCMHQLLRWFNFAERSLYISTEEFERTRSAREAQNTFWASIFSTFPLLFLGAGLYYGCVLGLGQSWGFSGGLLAAVGMGVYELGRRSSSF